MPTPVLTISMRCPRWSNAWAFAKGVDSICVATTIKIRMGDRLHGRLDGLEVRAPQRVVKLADAVGEARRSWLQDIGRLHFNDVIADDGRHSIPAGPADDRLLAH